MDIILRDRLKFLKLIEWMNENDMLNNDLGLVDYEVAETFQETDTYKNFQASEKASNCFLGDVSKRYLLEVITPRCNNLYTHVFNALNEALEMQEHLESEWDGSKVSIQLTEID